MEQEPNQIESNIIFIIKKNMMQESQEQCS